MKNYILISILSLSVFSCRNSHDEKIINLEIENKELKSQIEQLRDSLSDFEQEFLYSQILIGVADHTILKVGKKNNVVMLFQTYDRKLPEYEIYKVDGKEQIKIGTNNNTRFNYNFTPKSIDDKTLNLRVKMRYKGKVIEFPASMYFEVQK